MSQLIWLSTNPCKVNDCKTIRDRIYVLFKTWWKYLSPEITLLPTGPIDILWKLCKCRNFYLLCWHHITLHFVLLTIFIPCIPPSRTSDISDCFQIIRQFCAPMILTIWPGTENVRMRSVFVRFKSVLFKVVWKSGLNSSHNCLILTWSKNAYILHTSQINFSNWIKFQSYQWFKLYKDFHDKSWDRCDICGFSRKNDLKGDFETDLTQTVRELEFSDTFWCFCSGVLIKDPNQPTSKLPCLLFLFFFFRYICIKHAIYYRTNVTVTRMKKVVVVVWVAIILYLSSLLTFGRQEFTDTSCLWKELFNFLVAFFCQKWTL